ncbi:hypothetical protein HDU98_005955 [Podochytrium sp. JEL0797]|nr:hypothetical protein HDU98_005955 [Podochytrium sp. JEL0797]
MTSHADKGGTADAFCTICEARGRLLELKKTSAIASFATVAVQKQTATLRTHANPFVAQPWEHYAGAFHPRSSTSELSKAEQDCMVAHVMDKSKWAKLQQNPAADPPLPQIAAAAEGPSNVRPSKWKRKK